MRALVGVLCGLAPVMAAAVEPRPAEEVCTATREDHRGEPTVWHLVLTARAATPKGRVLTLEDSVSGREWQHPDDASKIEVRHFRHRTRVFLDGKLLLAAFLERGAALGADRYELAYGERTASVRCAFDRRTETFPCTGTVDGQPLVRRDGLAGEPHRRDRKPIPPFAPMDDDLLQGLRRLDAEAKRNRSHCRPQKPLWSANCGDCYAPDLTCDGSSLIRAAIWVSLGPGFNGRGAPVGSTGEAWLEVFESVFWCGTCVTPGTLMKP